MADKKARKLRYKKEQDQRDKVNEQRQESFRNNPRDVSLARAKQTSVYSSPTLKGASGKQTRIDDLSPEEREKVQRANALQGMAFKEGERRAEKLAFENRAEQAKDDIVLSSIPPEQQAAITAQGLEQQTPGRDNTQFLNPGSTQMIGGVDEQGNPILSEAGGLTPEQNRQGNIAGAVGVGAVGALALGPVLAPSLVGAKTAAGASSGILKLGFGTYIANRVASFSRAELLDTKNSLNLAITSAGQAFTDYEAGIASISDVEATIDYSEQAVRDLEAAMKMAAINPFIRKSRIRGEIEQGKRQIKSLRKRLALTQATANYGLTE